MSLSVSACECSLGGMLLERGWDPRFGARPVKRAIQRLVKDPLSRLLLAGDRFEEGDVILADAAGEELVFEKRAVS